MTKLLLFFSVLSLVLVTRSSAAPQNFGLNEPYESVTEQYLLIQHQLYSDTMDGVTPAAMSMEKTVDADAGKSFSPQFPAAAAALAQARDLPAARAAFKSVSLDLVAAFKNARISTGMLHLIFCPMADASWIQTDVAKAHNPYFGSARPDCGDTVGNF